MTSSCTCPCRRLRIVTKTTDATRCAGFSCRTWTRIDCSSHSMLCTATNDRSSARPRSCTVTTGPDVPLRPFVSRSQASYGLPLLIGLPCHLGFVSMKRSKATALWRIPSVQYSRLLHLKSCSKLSHLLKTGCFTSGIQLNRFSNSSVLLPAVPTQWNTPLSIP